jgi:type III secretory pathway component EscR
MIEIAFNICAIVSVAINAGLFIMAPVNFSTMRKIIQTHSEQQINSRIMDHDGLKLESTETFTKIAKESPILQR